MSVLDIIAMLVIVPVLVGGLVVVARLAYLVATDDIR